MTYSIKRLIDGEGDSGDLSIAVWLDKDENRMFDLNARPRKGIAIGVGSLLASLPDNEYYLTGIIQEIVEDTGNYVKFKTADYVYEWREH
jgi:hypothetical protein